MIDDGGVDPARVRRVVMTSGKLYYDLLKAREERGRRATWRSCGSSSSTRSRRPSSQGALARYVPLAELVWAQEEPRNMGAWRFVRERFLDGDVRDLGPARSATSGRAASASPAPGSHKFHVVEQDALVSAALSSNG